MEIVGSELHRHVARLLGRPRAVGVDHDGHALAHRQPGRPHLGLLGLVQLDVAIALVERLLGPRRHFLGIAIFEQAGVGRQAVASGAAQQAMQRQVGRLAGDVPQRDVEPRQGEDGDAVAAEQVQLLLQVVAELRDVARILADRERRDHVVQGRAHGIGAGIAERFAPADDARVRLDPHQQDVVCRPGAQALALVTAAEGVRHLDRMAVDARDLHSIFPFVRISASMRSACARSASRFEVKRRSPAGASASRCPANGAGKGGGALSSSGISTSAWAK